MTEINTPALFFPGTQCDERVWMPVWQASNFSNRHYVPLQWAETLEQMLMLSQDRLDAVEHKADLIGFSLGGYIASLLALQNPLKVKSLTLIGYNPQGLTQNEVISRRALLAALNKNQVIPFNNTRLRQFITQQELNEPKIVDTIKQMDADLGNAVLKAHISATTPRQDLCDPLAKCDFPIHFIVGQEDNIAPAQSVKNHAESMRQSKYRCLADTAHMVVLSQPQKVAQILTDWLA